MRKLLLLIPLLGIIISLPNENDSYTCIKGIISDKCEVTCTEGLHYKGESFLFTDNHYQIGDSVTIIFDDNGTPNDITDDIIYNIVKED